VNTDGLPPWLQLGSVTVFAAVVWWEQRSMRRSLETVMMMLAAMMGPERFQQVRRAARSTGRPFKTPPPGLFSIENDQDSK
jgi:hypothetical protein